jgi:RNA-directed DNA polymerase
MKTRLKELTSRRSIRSIRPSLEKIKVYMRGWLNYYGVADIVFGKYKFEQCGT